MIKYVFPCYPGDTVWHIVSVNGNPLYSKQDTVQMVGFTTRSVQIKLRNSQSFGKTYTWGKNVFATKEEADSVITETKIDKKLEKYFHGEEKNDT